MARLAHLFRAPAMRESGAASAGSGNTLEDGADDAADPDDGDCDQCMVVRARGLREDAVDDGVKERRRELVNRFYRAQEQSCVAAAGATGGICPPYLAKSFVRGDVQAEGKRCTYEWWSSQRARDAGILDVERRAKPLDRGRALRTASDDLGLFQQMLEDHRIDAGCFGVGKAKTLAQLAAEVRDGSCRLMLDATEHRKLVRVVDFVGVRLMPVGGQGPERRRLLVETEEQYPDGRKRETVRLPGTKKRPHENARRTAERIMEEMLQLDAGAAVLDMGTLLRFEEEFESPSYPGVTTVYRKEIVDAVVGISNPSQLAQIGLPGFGGWSATDKEGNTKFFSWMTEAMATAKQVKVRADGADGAMTASTLVRAPIGLGEEALRAHLTSLGVDVGNFGHVRPASKLAVATLVRANIGLSEEALRMQLTSFGTSGRSRTLKEFSAELIRGEASLVPGPNGGVLRAVDVVLLILRNPKTDEILVQASHEQPDGQRTTVNRLPGDRCRPDEHHFISARRILRKQLEIDENDVRLDQEVLLLQDERSNDAYPGLATICRKRLIRGELVPPAGTAA